MPDVTFRCPACENPIAADMSLAGRIVPCPHCAANVPIPGTAPPPVPVPRPLLPAPAPPSEWRTLLKFNQLIGVVLFLSGAALIWTAGSDGIPAANADTGGRVLLLGVLFWGVPTFIRWWQRP